MKLLKSQFLFSAASKDGGLKRELQEFEKQLAKNKKFAMMAGNNKSSKLKTRNNSTNNKNRVTPHSTPTSTSSTTESEPPVTKTYASTTSSSKPKVKDLEIANIENNKTDKSNKQVTLEQMLRESQSCNLVAANVIELMKMKVDKLKQYSRRSCLVILKVELSPNKTTESVEETQEIVHKITETNLYISTEDLTLS